MLTSKFPFTLITGRARQLLDRVETQLQRGEISSRSGFLTALVGGLRGFMGGLQGPSMQVPYLQADQHLIREDVEEPVAQADQDLRLAAEQVAAVRDLTHQIFNLCQAERAGLQERLREVTSLTDAFRLWVSDSDPHLLWVGDTFNDTRQVDPTSTVWVDDRSGVVTLRTTSQRSLSQYLVDASLDPALSRGGLPGHNLEVQAPGQEAFTGDQREPLPRLYADTRPAPDRLAHLWDGEPGTWFEWERYHVPVPQPVIRAGKAWVYDPSGKRDKGVAHLPNWNCYLRWPGGQQLDTGERRKGYPLATFDAADLQTPLRLGINLTLDEPRRLSWLQLTPLIRHGHYPVVEQILVSHDGQVWRSLLAEPTTLHPRMNRGIDFTQLGFASSNYEGIGVWSLPATPLRHLKVILRQDEFYECPLGVAHPFYVKRGEGRTRGPVQVVGDFAAVPGPAEPLDYAESAATTRRKFKLRYDLFRGYRQAIGIRDLLLEERLYAEAGQLVSRPFTLARPVRAVALFVTEQIPEDWGLETPWIQYEVSGDGQTWAPLIPQRSQLEDSVVQFPAPTRQVWFRAAFQRPADLPHESPVLLAYGLKLLPE
jgi:hypothetical protein